MLLNCKPKCSSRDGRTSGSLDKDANEVVCDHCGDIIPNISPFTKKSMLAAGDVIKHKVTKAFMFDCTSCNKKVQAVVRDGQVAGKGCSRDDCCIKISGPMTRAIELTQGKDDD